MPRINAQQFAEKWGRRTAAATQDYVNGVKSVTIAPSQQAVAQKELLKAKLMKAIDDGTWENGLLGVTLADWQGAATGKGAQRIAAGVAGAAQDVQNMATRLLPAIDAAVAVVNQTPRGDIEQNIARSATFAREMAKNAPRRNR